MDDNAPDPLANLDQMVRGLVDVAKCVRALYCGLTAEGFTESEALRLSGDWLRGMAT